MNYGVIYIGRIPEAYYSYAVDTWKGARTIVYNKYTIKETDRRIKTATFTSPDYIDLTTGLYCILISSKYHENFGGIILESEYDEDKDLYTYQCQDWSRLYNSRSTLWTIGTVTVYRLLQYLITNGNSTTPITKPLSKDDKTAFKTVLAGLKPLDYYNQDYYKGNIFKGNPFKQKYRLLVKAKTNMELIRDLVFNSLGYFDIWFNDRGVLQIEALSKTDWENTGLILSDGDYLNRKVKFSTTNAITNVKVTNEGFDTGSWVTSYDALNLRLSAFFGVQDAEISNPNKSDKNTSNATTNNNKSGNTVSANNKYNNPFNNKPKNVWINADGGSGSMKEKLATELRKEGWNVHVGGTDAKYHYDDYFKVTSKYSVYITLYNGFCAGTMREAYSSKIQNVLKSKGVQLCPIWDTGSWHNQKTRYGNFDGYYVPRAHDDNFSSGNPSIKDAGAFLKSNKATYCASPSASQIMQQFKAGGYFKYKGINV